MSLICFKCYIFQENVYVLSMFKRWILDCERNCRDLKGANRCLPLSLRSGAITQCWRASLLEAISILDGDRRDLVRVTIKDAHVMVPYGRSKLSVLLGSISFTPRCTDTRIHARTGNWVDSSPTGAHVAIIVILVVAVAIAIVIIIPARLSP